MSTSTTRTVGYWLTTLLMILPMGIGAIADIIQPPEVAQIFTRLGYPSYFGVMLGVAKMLGMLTILTPGLVRLKEWAYAGMAIDLVAAFVSHAVVDGFGVDALPPVVFLIVLFVSYALRPASRRLAGPIV